MSDLPHRPAASILLSLMLTCSLLPTVRQPAVETAGPSGMPAAMNEALKGLGANGWTTPSEAPAVAVPVPTAAGAQTAPSNAPPISADQLNKLIGKTLAATAQGPVSQRMTRFLGLTQGNDQLIVKQFFNQTATASHLFSVPVDGSVDRLVLIFAEKDRIRWIVTDRAGQLIPGNAGASVRRGEEPSFLSDSETQDLYKSEMAIWAETASRI